MDIMFNIVTIVFSIVYVILLFVKYAKNLEKILFNNIFKGHSKLEQLALGARVARFCIIFNAFIQKDLLDGKLDKLDSLESHIKNLMN